MTIDEFFEIVDNIEPDDKGCKIWPRGCSGNGYSYVLLEGRPNSGHRAVLQRKLQRGIKPGFHALHDCDVRNCVNEDHIYEGTPLQNMLDKEKRGRGNHPTQKKHPHMGYQKIISEETELRIMELSKNLSAHKIADIIKIHQTTVSRIVKKYK